MQKQRGLSPGRAQRVRYVGGHQKRIILLQRALRGIRLDGERAGQNINEADRSEIFRRLPGRQLNVRQLQKRGSTSRTRP